MCAIGAQKALMYKLCTVYYCNHSPALTGLYWGWANLSHMETTMHRDPSTKMDTR